VFIVKNAEEEVAFRISNTGSPQPFGLRRIPLVTGNDWLDLSL
jgi:hypothetical protein